MSYKGIETVDYLSIFGLLRLPQAAYAQPDGGYEYPMDGHWNRPANKYSYLLQKWLHAVAVEDDYREAPERLNEILDLSLMPNMPQRPGRELVSWIGVRHLPSRFSPPCVTVSAGYAVPGSPPRPTTPGSTKRWPAPGRR